LVVQSSGFILTPFFLLFLYDSGDPDDDSDLEESMVPRPVIGRGRGRGRRGGADVSL